MSTKILSVAIALIVFTTFVLFLTHQSFLSNDNIVLQQNTSSSTVPPVSNTQTFTLAFPSFTVIIAPDTCDDLQCSGPGVARITLLLSGKEQELRSEELLFNITDPLTVPTEPSELSGYRPIAVADYNFDGNDDICLSNGTHGGYGANSCDMYLYEPQREEFVFHAELTNISNSSLGYLGVDTDKKLLSSFRKSGCCEHTDTLYSMQHNVPVLFYEISTSSDLYTGTQTVTEKKLDQNGEISVKTWSATE